MSAQWKSVTFWSAYPYLVEVRVFGFKSQRSADLFGNSGLRLRVWGDELHIECPSGLNTRIVDEQITVLRLTPEALASTSSYVLESDYERVTIPIAKFREHPELQSFGSQAYSSSPYEPVYGVNTI
jgi:hypothetical protein